MTPTLKILIVGGYGTFGGRIVSLLENEPRLTIIVAGRSMEKAASFCASRDSKAELLPAVFDRDGDLKAQLASRQPAIVVDASGPFQAYGDERYRLIEACLESRVNYLDLADGSDFVAGVGVFDAAARQAGIFILSGVSSFPVLTAAVVRRLSLPMHRVDKIRGGIAPSPYAGVGENVIRAIASYAGQTVQRKKDGEVSAGRPMTEQMRYTIAPPGRLPLRNTLFSLVDVPDLRVLTDLWPEAKTVWMGAGPVPETLHRALIALARLVSAGVIRSLSPMAPLMLFATKYLRWGEHRGGMFVLVEGVDNAAMPLKRSWHLLAEGDDGPLIPSMAVEALVRRTLDGDAPTVGARACIEDLEIDDYDRLLAGRTIYAAIRDDTVEDTKGLYPRLLGSAWQDLPPELRDMHGLDGAKTASGRASIERGTSILARLAAGIIGFPKAGTDVEVDVRFETKDGGELWTRQFGDERFSSFQSAGSGRSSRLLCERFGPMTFAMALVWDGSRLSLTLRRWSVFGIPLPMRLCPRSNSYETSEDGRFRFHVDISHPLTGLIVRYRGWLKPVQDQPQGLSTVGSPAIAPRSRQEPAAHNVQPSPVAPEAASTISGRGGSLGV